VKQKLALTIEESDYSSIAPSPSLLRLIYLALTLGLEEDPPGAVERMAGLVEAGSRHDIEHSFQMTIATTVRSRSGAWMPTFSS
jgi:hypothetical protein